jgi:hypothetical protein
MRSTIAMTTICLLAGCSGPQPKPPEVQGEYRPINRVEVPQTAGAKPALARTFDFQFEGDLVASLNALHGIQPQLTVLAPVGKVSAIPVRLNLRNVTLDEALQSIGSQTGGKAEVVFKTTGHAGLNQAFVRFRAPSSSATGPVALSSQDKTK